MKRPGKGGPGQAAETGSGLRILIVDDEANIRRTLEFCLTQEGHQVESVGSAGEACAQVRDSPFDLAFLDLRLGGESGMDVIPRLLNESPWLKIIVITAFATIESAVEAMRRGATDYLPKPFSPDQVRLTVRRLGHLRALETRCFALGTRLQEMQEPLLFESVDPATRKVLELARQAADSDATMLLEGETGTGKTLLAHAIHDWSPRRDRPFAVISCPSLNQELLESELFGHVKGAFTGATQDNPGRIASCEGGTILLDEIGDLSMTLQPKLLRFLQDRQFERVGDHNTRRANVRILAATNVCLKAAVEQKTFRADLYHRLEVISLRIPPLRERPGDVMTLAKHFLEHLASRYRKTVSPLSPAAGEALQRYAWPGNVRELRNIIERAVILNRGDQIGFPELAGSVASPPALPRIGDLISLDELEKAHIKKIVERAPTLQEAARILGIDVATLYRKRKELVD